MTKISNQRAYIPDEEINGLDYLPGTDFDQALKTVNFRVQDLGTHYNQVNGVRNFDYNFYAHSGSNPKPADGYFYSNSNEQDPNNITYFVFSKKTARFKDTTNFFESISTENPFDLIIAQKVDINTIFFFRIDSIETFSGYYKLNVSEVFFPNAKELSYTLSYAVFNLKNEEVGPIPTKTSDLTNDGEDSTSTYLQVNKNIKNEIPLGTINGINAIFTTQFPLEPNSEDIFINGQKQKKPDDYNISGQTITFTFSPGVSESLVINYIKQ